MVTYKDGQVLETLSGVCDGRSITVASGMYTLPNITALLDLNGTFTDIGNSFSYKPPSGTKQVIYTMKVHTAGEHDHAIAFYKLFVDNTEVKAFWQGANGRRKDELMILTWTFSIGDVATDDIANAKFATWDASKTIKIQGAELVGNGMTIFGGVYFEATQGSMRFIAPILEIQAIGRQVAPASAADFKIQKVDTISTPPNNGNMLTWDAAKGRWKPSEFIVANDDGTKNISSIDMYDGYEITASSEYQNNGGKHAPHNAFRDAFKRL